MKNFLHFCLLIWKNFKIHIRHPFSTALELFIPIVLMLLLILLRLTATIYKRDIETPFSSYDVETLPDNFNSTDNIIVYYTPKSTFIDVLMDKVGKQMNVTPIGFDTEEELVASYVKSSSRILAGICFPEDVKNGVQFYGQISFTIRPESIRGNTWNLSHYLPAIPLPELAEKSIYGSEYMTYGFLPVQHAVSKALLENSLSDLDQQFDDMFEIRMHRFPFPEYESDSFYKGPEYFVSFAICLSFLFPSTVIARNIVQERQSKLKQTLLMMGISNWQNWLAWFFKDFVFFIIICLIITLLLSIQIGGPAVFNRSDAALIFLFLLLYSCNVILFTYFITTFFRKEKSAISATCILFLLTVIPYIHSRGVFHQLPLYAQFVFCILPNTLLASSCRNIVNVESLGRGLQWRTMHYTDIIDVSFSMNTIFLMFIIEFFMFTLLTWYSEVMHPDKFSAKHPWYFPFTAYYWTGTKGIPTELSPSKLQRVNSQQFEKYPKKVKPMIYLRNVKKVYDDDDVSNPVLKEINLRAYKGQITVILSHEYAGKSAITSMLYGILSPTSGSIFIKDSDLSIPYEAHKSKALLGICPDYDMNIEELTIEENLYFFCNVKGVSDSAAGAEIDKILESFDLEIKKKFLASSLSPNIKRRLTIGISLIGESEVVILDEPTLHLDSYNRRMVWEALRQAKKYRCILLMTSNVIEANNLADKIAVIHNGELKCSGSPLFLKKRHGAGYRIIIPKQPDCKTIMLKNIVSTKIPGAQVISDTESEIQFNLPHDSSNLYASLFNDLEEQDLNIGEVIVNETSLDVWFERMTGESYLGSKKMEAIKSVSSRGANEETCYRSLSKERNEGFALFWQHMIALFRKQYIFSRRNIFLTLSQLFVLPLFFIFSNLIEDSISFSSVESSAGPQFSMNPYANSNVAYGIDPSSNTTIDLGDTYARLLGETEIMYMVDLDEENYLAHLLKQAKKDIMYYKTKYIIGAVFANYFNKSLITAYYNSDAYHSAPTSLLYVYNAILSYFVKGKTYFLNVKNKPLPYKDEEYKFMSTKFDLDISFFWAEDVMIGMAIIMASFVVILSTEKSTKSKQQQIICGLNAFVYWLSTFLYDFAIYLIPCIISLVVFSAFKTECLSEIDELGPLMLLFVLHGIAGLLFIFCTTFCHSSPSAAYIGIFLYYFVGFCLLGAVNIMEMRNMYYISEPLNILFTAIMPSYCVGRGIYNVHRNCIGYYICTSPAVERMCKFGNMTDSITTSCCLDTCGDKCIYWSASHFSVTAISGIGKQLICLAIQPFILCIILILLELEIFQDLKCRQKEVFTDLSQQNSDEDVQSEASRIYSSTVSELKRSNQYLVVKGASKYLRPEFNIKKLTFAVKKGECFGLLGLEQAGKSTILEMIAGSIFLTTGNVYIDGYNQAEHAHKVQDKVGFSFGSYALLKKFTVKETLMLYAHIRGIPENEIPHFIKSLTSTLKLKLDALVKKCNDIEKRKLNVAISIIGTPPLVLLDEPTAQMDPLQSMYTEKAIRQALEMGCTVFFSSQRLDECQALCNRIGILLKGKMTYIGDFEKLKQRFEGGFIMSLRVKKVKQSKSRYTRKNIDLKGYLNYIKDYIQGLLLNAVLKIEYTSYLNFYIPKRLIPWSKIFTELELLKTRDFIYDYYIGVTTLEHTFTYLVNKNDSKVKEIAEFLQERKKSQF